MNFDFRLTLIFPLLFFALASCSKNEKGLIMTVSGPVPSSETGIILSHEHVLVDFIGADSTGYHRWDRSEAMEVILPYLLEAKEAGLKTFFDCTPAFLGRDVRLLRWLADTSGLNIVTNTGLYGASDNRHLPLYAFDASADELAELWIREFERGIGGSGLRPGFIKIGVNPGPLSPLHRKLIRAAARTHKQTGLAIASHTGPSEAAFEQLDILDEEGVSSSAFIWVHAQNEENLDRHLEAAERGAWISFDGLSEANTEKYLQALQYFKEHKILDQILLSHDAGWYSPGEPYGGSFRGYMTLLTSFRDLMLKNGFTEDDYNLLAHRNPVKAFALDEKDINDLEQDQ
ncbi:MAG: phosphotriesterase [Cyclobacteriaceae bacterium]